MLRKAKKLSQTEMAENVNLSQKAYSKIECSETQLTFERITEIARLLGYNSWQLISLDADVILGKQPMPNDVVNYVPIELVKRLFDEYEAKIKILEEKLEKANEIITQLKKPQSSDNNAID